MKRLFQIKAGAITVYFESKKQAKVVRDQHNKDIPSRPVVISRGPDHWKGESA